MIRTHGHQHPNFKSAFGRSERPDPDQYMIFLKRVGDDSPHLDAWAFTAECQS
jgi:hypothetical protein